MNSTVQALLGWCIGMSTLPSSGKRPWAASNRITLREVASRAGVSAMTVSRALRNHPEVSTATKTSILEIAAKLGYHPDPELTRLMVHLRSTRNPGYKASLCALSDGPEATMHHYAVRVLGGARLRARELGYSLEVMRIPDGEAPRMALRRILASRGIEGLLLLPMNGPQSLDGLLDWAAFSVVAATSSIASPQFHQVSPRHFTNTLMLCEELRSRGYRRIGLVIDESQDLRVGHAFTGALARHGLFEGGEFVPPLCYNAASLTGLGAWFKKHKPDCIVTGREDHIPLFARVLKLRVPGQLAFASTNAVPDSGGAGIDERPYEIGRWSIDLLTTMVQRGEKGIPTVSMASMIAGRWIDGISCPKKRPIGTRR